MGMLCLGLEGHFQRVLAEERVPSLNLEHCPMDHCTLNGEGGVKRRPGERCSPFHYFLVGIVNQTACVHVLPIIVDAFL